MIDQNQPEIQDNLEQETVVPSAPGEIDSSAFSEATQVPSDVSPLPPPPPEVIMSAGSGKVPKGFYFIFGITLIVFFTVTALLVNSLLQKPGSSSTSTDLSPTESTPSVLPSATSVPKEVIEPEFTSDAEVTDQAVMSLIQYSSSDEISEIQADIDNTDLSSIEEGLEILDEQIGVISD